MDRDDVLHFLQALQEHNAHLAWDPEDLYMHEVDILQEHELLLHFAELQHLPSEIGLLTDLVHLELSGNPHIVLPDALGKLADLKQLYCCSCHLSTLPATLGHLQHVQSLHVGWNQLQHVPSWVHNLKRLQYLSLSHNHLTELPEWLGTMTHLKTLHLSNNVLVALPTTLHHLHRLEDLDLSTNPMSVLPTWVGALKNLKMLAINETGIQLLPHDLMYLPHLARLETRGTGLPLPDILAPHQEVMNQLIHYFVHAELLQPSDELTRLGAQGRIEALVAHMEGSGYDGKAVLAVLNTLERETVVPHVTALLAHPRHRMQMHAAKVVLALKFPEASALVLPLLHHPDPRVRQYLCGLLSLYGNEAVVEPLADVLRYDRNKEVRFDAAWALGKVGDQRAIPALAHAAATEIGYTTGGYSVASTAAESLDAIKQRASSA